MKFAGQSIEKNICVVPIIRGNQTFNLVLAAVEDPDGFDKLCPKPEPIGSIRHRDGKVEPRYDTPEYVAALKQWHADRTTWMVIQTLKATPEVTWDRVNEDDPNTYKFMQDELEHDSGLTTGEVLELIQNVYMVNGLNEDKVEAARASFFRSRQAVQAQ